MTLRDHPVHAATAISMANQGYLIWICGANNQTSCGDPPWTVSITGRAHNPTLLVDCGKLLPMQQVADALKNLTDNTG